MSLIELFPNLASAEFHVTSPESTRYNCLAWAAGENHRWWQPDGDEDTYWPAAAPDERTVSAIVAAYGTLGYQPCAESSLENDADKIAIYALNGQPTHASRQLPNGNWSSKVGTLEDIEHTLAGLEGNEYGIVVQILKRTRH